MKKAKNKRVAMTRALRALSNYIRHRDKFTCISCGKQGTTKNIDAGHLFSRRYKYLLFAESNINAQCVYCNRYLKGNWDNYLKNHILKYGKEEALKLESVKNVLVKYTIEKLFEIEEYFIDKLEVLNELS